MANKVAKIGILEQLIQNRNLATENGKVQIGAFWAILQIYYCLQIGVSPQTLCDLASQLDGRLDHNYMPTTAKINPNTLRKWLRLDSIPKHIGHTVVTKEVAQGISDATADKIKEVLVAHNSYGDEILSQLVSVVESGRGEFLRSRASTMGAGDFNAVLTMAIAIRSAHQQGVLKLDNVPNAKHQSYIKQQLQKNDVLPNRLLELPV